jgi:hypothetical protein
VAPEVEGVPGEVVAVTREVAALPREAAAVPGSTTAAAALFPGPHRKIALPLSNFPSSRG